MPHELFLTTRQKTETRNAFAIKNMSTDVKLSKAQLIKIIQSDRFLRKGFGNVISNLGKKALLDLVFPLAKDVLPKLALKQLRLY